MQFKLDDTFTNELPADQETGNRRRQVANACYSWVTPRVPSDPKVLHVSPEMAATLGLSDEDISSADFLNIFSGAATIEGSRPYAMCYGGHQFGNWAGQLGDGRAINLGEVIVKDKRWTLQLKGAGETPYSRGADGFAVLRSSIREHLCSEAMHHLGVPTTRSLSLITTGDEVLRDMMYDGNAAYEKGAVVCRVAPTFIRFGNFQILSARKEYDLLRQLTDYTIQHFFPFIDTNDPERFTKFFTSVADQTLDMIVHWLRVGFVHGVMNTDNLSILGLTIDYGPYGWLEGYDPNWTPNTTDRQGKRYRFGYQPNIALWNLFQLANALVPIVTDTGKTDTAGMQQVLDQFRDKYLKAYHKMMLDKLGIASANESLTTLIESLEENLQLSETDMTIFFRNLAHFNKDSVIDKAGDYLKIIEKSFYNLEDIQGPILSKWNTWFETYINLLKEEKRDNADRVAHMNQTNPKYVLRNYMAQLAIDKADKGDYSLIDTFYKMLQRPYDEQVAYEEWFAKRPEWARHKVGCSMLSCSS